MGESKDAKYVEADHDKTVRNVDLARDLTSLHLRMFLADMPGKYFSESVAGVLEGKHEEKKLREKMESMEIDYRRRMGSIYFLFGSMDGYMDYKLRKYANPDFSVLKGYMSENGMGSGRGIGAKGSMFGPPLRIFKPISYV
ncbi:MAG: hypothetical protein HY833_03165 [Candidatus Aenigmarchaeota archaeon]|nr:hypothetical protein [Candidatus Aenigmarchaeota archaeon]